MGDLHRLTAREAARLLRAGGASPADLAADLRAAIARDNPALNAYTWLARDGEEPPAGPPPARCPLWGLGYALKANIWSRGQPTDCGSRLLDDWRPAHDAEAVARLRAGGCFVLGKTTMDEFAMGSSTENAAGGPARNPWRTDRVPGGSSGGAAAAVAADLAFFALGSDTGGSVRQPAHCCGVVGLKPTYGRVSRRGLVALASSLDQIGPLAKDVADCALVYAAIAGHDPGDATSRREAVGDPASAAQRPARGLRVGVPRRLLGAAGQAAAAGGEALAQDAHADFQSTLDDLRAQGVALVEVDLPTLPHAVAIYRVIADAEAAANLARYDGVRFGRRRAAPDYAAAVAATRTAGLGVEVKLRVLLGAFVLAEGYRDAYYERARRARSLLAAEFAAAFAACDAVATPTAPTAAFPLGERADDPLRMYLADVFTVPANLAGLPALTVPTGLDGDGLPLSIQLIGPPLAEETLLTLGGAVEQARGFRALKEAAWRRR